MQIVYACQALPGEQLSFMHHRNFTPNSIFLAGPTPRDDAVESWRPEALRVLEKLGFKGHVFIPETEGGGWHGDYKAQVYWEWEALGRAASVVFWVPRELKTMPAFTTNVEFGILAALHPNRIVLGAPRDAPKLRYLRTIAKDRQKFADAFHLPVNSKRVATATTLENTLKLAMRQLENGIIDW